jgi:hypothetical protein
MRCPTCYEEFRDGLWCPKDGTRLTDVEQDQHQASVSTPPTQAPAPSAPAQGDDLASLRFRLRAYREQRQFDRAWCLCAALAFLRQADADEQMFFEQYRPRGFVLTKARMTDELWRHLVFHPAQDRLVSAILAAVGPLVGAMTARPHKAFGLKRKHRRDLATDQLLFSKVFVYVTAVLNVEQSELYLLPEQQTGLLSAHTTEAASFVVGAELLQGKSERELAFAVARRLAYLRPEHRLCTVFTSPPQLHAVLLAALRLVDPGRALPSVAEVDQLVRYLASRLPPAQLEQLRRLTSGLAHTPTEQDLARWMSAVELTSQRAGLILCADLETAAGMIRRESTQAGLPVEEAVRQLLAFGVSEEYCQVREHLGLSLGA